MEEILKAIPEKLEPTGLYLTEAERKHIAEALRKAGFQQCEEMADDPDQVQGMAKELFEYGIKYDPYIIGYEGDIAKHLTSKGYHKDKRGEWIEDSLVDGVVICSLCGYTDNGYDYDLERWGGKFCGNCGADMRGDGE